MTRAWDGATVKDGHAQLFKGPMKPVDEKQLAVWKKASAEPPVRAR
ncbi:hypothetical protein PUR49_32395 [Streptomyces sp. BE147]|nr:hypothetical protein [Streptomyces sp. BE147]MEE1741174.1 hypothetical protein [Streptomyces sp. BE147]